MKLNLFRRKAGDAGEPAEETVPQPSPPERERKGPEAVPTGERLRPLPEKALPDGLTIARLILAALLIVLTLVLKNLPVFAVIALRAVAAAGACFDLILEAVGEIRRKSFTFSGLPLILAVILAFCNGMSLEGAVAAVVFFLALSVRDYIFCRSQGDLLAAASLPKPGAELSLGDSLMLEDGVPVCADCRIVQGSVTADLSFVLGDRAERGLKTGDIIPAGSVCLRGSALAEVVGLPEDTVSSAISSRMAGGFKDVTQLERRAERLLGLLTPLLLLVSVLILVLLPLTTELPFREALRRVTGIIAIASPCAVLASIPIAWLAHMSALRRAGAAFLSAKALDETARTGVVVFDKTGTITADSFTVTGVSTDRMDPKTFLRVAAHAASVSEAPIARAIVAACGEPLNHGLLSDASETPGWGVSVTVDNIAILLGVPAFMDKRGVDVPPVIGEETRIYMAVGGIAAGYISLENSLDPSAAQVVGRLAEAGVGRMAMVSGDSRERDAAVSSAAGLNEYYAECSEDDKARFIDEISAKMAPGSTLAYVSSRSGSDTARRAAQVNIITGAASAPFETGGDVLLLSASVDRVPMAVLGAKRSRKTLILLLAAALGLKLLTAALAACGFLPLWFCVVLDSAAALGLLLAAGYIRPKIKE